MNITTRYNNVDIFHWVTSTHVFFSVSCRTKIQLANEIDDYTKKLLEDYEDLDKLSIQADIWHSKYKASRSVNLHNNNHNNCFSHLGLWTIFNN